MKYHYSLRNKVIFYLSYLYYKITIFLECRRGSSAIYLAEFLWVINRVFGTKFILPSSWQVNYVETTMGKFNIPQDLMSLIVASPAFERRDINFLLQLIAKSLREKKKVLFMDIGASFGLYSIIVGNQFKRNKVDIVAFEPDTSYLTNPAYAMLEKNIKDNKITRIKVYKKGIGSKESKDKNKLGFKTYRLDTLITEKQLRKYDTVYIKVDVDDYAMDVLKGIEKSVQQANEVILLVEDFVDRKTIPYLNARYKFIDKLTSYNSFWQKRI